MGKTHCILGSLLKQANPMPRIYGVKGQQVRYQLITEPITLSDLGNGWDEPQIVFALELRRLLDGTPEAVVRLDYYYRKNNIHSKKLYDYSEILGCTSFDDVAKGLAVPATIIEYAEGYGPDLCKPPLHSGWHDSLEKALAVFGFGR